MVPSCFVRIDCLPRTANGKPDRSALPEPELKQAEQEYVAPISDDEKKLCNIIQNMLNIDRVGIPCIKSRLVKSYQEAMLEGIPAEDLLRKCKHTVNIRMEELKDSMAICKTTNMTNSPGVFGLMRKNDTELKKWIKLYRMIEKEHPHILYQFEKDALLNLKLKQQLMEI